MISAVVLAAGLSRRMGETKLLLPMGCKTIIEHVVDNVRLTGVGEVIVVLGHAGDQIKQALADRDVTFRMNSRYGEGQGSSVAAGAAAVHPESSGILFLPGDQPLLGPECLNTLIREFNRTKPLIVRAVEPGIPTIFSTRLRPELVALQGDTGGRQLVEKYKQEVLTVPVDPGAIAMDVDNPEDYQTLLRLWQMKSTGRLLEKGMVKHAGRENS